MTVTRLAVIGLGKIARTEHLPAIAHDPRFELVTTVDPSSDAAADVPHYASIEAAPQLDAVAICTPPQFRTEIARAAIERGWHVLLEKPPAASVVELDALKLAARECGVTLFAAWHSRFAAGVEPARSWLAGRTIKRVDITWREDVRVWHPGQDWIWRSGGFGVFDPGINALSIVTHILPLPLSVRAAELSVPENRAAPIAARIEMQDAASAIVKADFDWRQTGTQTWDIVVETDAGVLRLRRGGAEVEAPGLGPVPPQAEYPALYRRFAELIASGASDADGAPLELAQSSLLIGRKTLVEQFTE